MIAKHGGNRIFDEVEIDDGKLSDDIKRRHGNLRSFLDRYLNIGENDR